MYSRLTDSFRSARTQVKIMFSISMPPKSPTGIATLFPGSGGQALNVLKARLEVYVDCENPL
jgi:hypothetical protein